MSALPWEKGVFIDSRRLDLKSVIHCLQALDAFPIARVTSVECDDRFGGFRIFLSHDEARRLLMKRYLMVSNQQAGVYPLTTSLLIQNIDVNADTERDLISAMQKFGKVLHYEKGPPDKVDDSPSHLVLLDVPEIDSLSVFQKNGYPRMTVAVPSMSKTFKVAFFCRNCKEADHCFRKCSQHVGLSAAETSGPPFLNSIQMHSGREDVPSASSHTVPELPESLPSKSTMKPLNNSATENEAGKQDSNNKARNISRIIDSLKKTKEQESAMSAIGSGDLSFRNLALDKPDSSEHIPEKSSEVKTELDEDASVQSTEGVWSPAGNATSTTDDEVEIVEPKYPVAHKGLGVTTGSVYTLAKTEVKNEPQSNGASEQSSLNSPPVTPKGNWDSQQPGPSTTLQHSHFNSTFDLSSKLEGCIERAYETHTVLDRQKLESFLIHVKKKSNPTRIANNYTTNVDGLEKQLKQILTNYYHMPETGTKNDSTFIKWLNGLVERFKVTESRKRKSHSAAGYGFPPHKR